MRAEASAMPFRLGVRKAGALLSQSLKATPRARDNSLSLGSVVSRVKQRPASDEGRNHHFLHQFILQDLREIGVFMPTSVRPAPRCKR